MVRGIIALLVVIAIVLVLLKVVVAGGILGLIAIILLVLPLLGGIKAGVIWRRDSRSSCRAHCSGSGQLI